MQKRISKLEILFILLMSAFILFFLVMYIQNPNGAERCVFFHKGSDFFADYINVMNKCKDGDPYLITQGIVDAERGYLPISYLIMAVLGKFSALTHISWNTDTISFLWITIFVFSWTVLLLLSLAKAQQYLSAFQRLIFLVLFSLSGIVLFSIERGNLIILCAVCIVIYLLYYNSNQKYKRHLAYLALALAAGLKVYPALLGLLVLKEKRYKEAVFLIVYGLIFAFLPFVFFGGFDAFKQMLLNVAANTQGYDNMLFPRFGWRYFKVLFAKEGNWGYLVTIYKYLTYIALGLTIPCALFEKKKWRLVSLILLAIITMQVNSALYCGLYLLPCLVMFFKEEKSFSFINITITILFVLIFKPLQMFAFDSEGIYTIGTIITNLATSGLWSIVICCSIVDALKKRICLNHPINSSASVIQP